jgi:hypothetical protein
MIGSSSVSRTSPTIARREQLFLQPDVVAVARTIKTVDGFQTLHPQTKRSAATRFSSNGSMESSTDRSSAQGLVTLADLDDVIPAWVRPSR